jgi:hypothetical protein
MSSLWCQLLSLRYKVLSITVFSEDPPVQAMLQIVQAVGACLGAGEGALYKSSHPDQYLHGAAFEGR